MNEFLKCELLHQSTDSKRVAKGQNTDESKEIVVEEELDKLFPPVTVTEDGEIKIIRVSRKQASMFEVYELSDNLENIIRKLENEKTGFSNKLISIYSQLFDELIRQEIIACPERGLLLVAVKKEALQTLECMQKLHRSCFAYGVTKDLLTRQETIKKQNDIPKFTQQIYQANQTLTLLKDEWKERKQREEEANRIDAIKKTFMENQLTMANQQLVVQIEDIIDSEHKWLKDSD